MGRGVEETLIHTWVEGVRFWEYMWTEGLRFWSMEVLNRQQVGVRLTSACVVCVVLQVHWQQGGGPLSQHAVCARHHCVCGQRQLLTVPPHSAGEWRQCKRWHCQCSVCSGCGQACFVQHSPCRGHDEPMSEFVFS